MLGSVRQLLTARVLALVVGLAGFALSPCHVAASCPIPPTLSQRSFVRRMVPHSARAVPPSLSLLSVFVASGPSLYTRPAATACVLASLRRCLACSLHPTFPVAVFLLDSHSQRLCHCFTSPPLFPGLLLVGSSLALAADQVCFRLPRRASPPFSLLGKGSPRHIGVLRS